MLAVKLNDLSLTPMTHMVGGRGLHSPHKHKIINVTFLNFEKQMLEHDKILDPVLIWV